MKAAKPHYRHWNNVPEGLVSKLELGREGLEPGGPPVATVSQSATARGHQPTLLYDRRDAVPKSQSDKALSMMAAAEERKEQQQHQHALQQIHEWQSVTLQGLLELAQLDPSSWVTLDTETTELVGEAISISVVDGNGQVLFDRLMQPVTPISDDAFGIHQISLQHLLDQPSFADLHLELKAVLEDKTVLAYNADFDRGTLLRTQKRFGLTSRDIRFPAEKWHCLMLDVAALFGRPDFSDNGHLQEFRYLSLGRARTRLALALHRPLQAHQAHSSLGDALATLELAHLLFEYAHKRQEGTLPAPLQDVSPYTLRPEEAGR